MKIAIIGGGPAGLYCGLLIKKANPGHDITIIERNPPDVTYGWGVVFSDRTLAAFQQADSQTYAAITKQFVIWDAIDIWYRGELIRANGHVLASISRRLLLNILQQRCAELGIALRFNMEVNDLHELAGYDLLIGADGINSVVRRAYAAIFKPGQEVGRARYIWYGTDKVFDCFTFIFRENEHGLFQVHAYPFGGAISTFIVECDETTWQHAGLDTASEATSITYCQRLFAEDLRGHALLSNNSRWINFITIKNQVWHHRNVVLLGDAAHTAHFSIGSGTKLAMEDAIALANAIAQCQDHEAALSAYELERKPVLDTFQQAARQSQRYFERTRLYTHLQPMQFAFHLLTRSGRISYDDLRLRDARFGDNIDRWLAQRADLPPFSAAGVSEPLQREPGFAPQPPRHDHGAAEQHRPQSAAVAAGMRPVVAPPPLFVPLALRQVVVPNRVVAVPISSSPAADGLPEDGYLAQLGKAALSGVGMVMTEPIAVSREGRITPACAGIYAREHVAVWAQVTGFVHAHSAAKIAIQLNHAGRRGSTRPRWEGLDRPLRTGNWPLVAASPIPYTPRSQVPQELDRLAMDQVCAAFVHAARLAQEAGFDILQLHCGHGYLLASFISPLTNARADAYGGSLAKRLRFPLAVFDAVRAVWPTDRPIAVAITAADFAPGGLTGEDAVLVARMFKAHGCDLVTILAGQTTPDSEPPYGRGFLTPLSDQVRNEAGIATMVGGYLTTTNDVNTILAAGHADLCVVALQDLDG
jgi:anthraniloyl-CoA monooxygenase